MAEFDFPASPAEGQVYGPVAGTYYVWNTPAWQMLGSGTVIVDSASIADVAPSAPRQGQLWWNSTNGNLYIWYDDGTSQQWVQINSVGT